MPEQVDNLPAAVNKAVKWSFLFIGTLISLFLIAIKSMKSMNRSSILIKDDVPTNQSFDSMTMQLLIIGIVMLCITGTIIYLCAECSGVVSADVQKYTRVYLLIVFGLGIYGLVLTIKLQSLVRKDGKQNTTTEGVSTLLNYIGFISGTSILIGGAFGIVIPSYNYIRDSRKNVSEVRRSSSRSSDGPLGRDFNSSWASPKSNAMSTFVF